MRKTLEDYKIEVDITKVNGQVTQIFDYKNYRATDATFLGILGFVVILFLIFVGPSIWNIKIDTVEEYIEFRRTIWWFAIAERIFCIAVITSFANKLNRNPLNWQFFAFFTPNLALIVIGLTKRKNNFFYEYKTSGDRTVFFNSLPEKDKLQLYNYLLKRAYTTISPHWWDDIAKFNTILFVDNSSALLTLQQFEASFKKNLVKVLKDNMPSDISLREKVFAPLEKIGLVNKAVYQPNRLPTR